MITTLRRDKLMRDIQKGKYLGKCAYRYTDDYQYDNASNFGETGFKQINIMDSEHKRDYDKINLYPDDFTSSCGRAWESEDGTVTLVIHSNLCYEFKKVA